MAPRVTVLQLDTDFPRVAGDVGSARTYISPPQIIRVPDASVRQVVSNRPEGINIAPFEAALKQATGDIIVTSCGFLSYWQDHLAAQTDKPFISSALTALDGLSQRYAPGEILILTFDEDSLTRRHLGSFEAYGIGIKGLPKDMHLRKVISQNLSQLDRAKAERELTIFLASNMLPAHKHLLLECTNLPPYKAAMQRATGLPVTDILTRIEATCPGAIQPQFIA